MDADKVFKALGDPTRRQLLDRLYERNGQTLGQLCTNLGMARQFATQHLGISHDYRIVAIQARVPVLYSPFGPGKLIEAICRNFRAYTFEKRLALLFNSVPMHVTSQIRTAPWMQDTLRQGFGLLAAGRTTEASECCRRLLSSKPDLVEAHFLLGLIALELRQHWTAVSAFGSVITPGRIVHLLVEE